MTYETADLVDRAAALLRGAEEIKRVRIHVEKAALVFGGYDDETGKAERIETQIVASRRPEELIDQHPIPDLIGHLCSRLPLTRSTVAEILRECGRLGDVSKNPQSFLDLAYRSIRFALDELLAAGIEYRKLEDGHYEMRLFTDTVATSYKDRVLEVDPDRSVSRHLVVDSNIERQFAERLNVRTDDVMFFMKLPRWFEVDTPLGAYRPDWAITKLGTDGVERIHLVKETKGDFDPAKLRPTEALKIRYGGRHFDALDVPYSVATSIDDL